MRADALDTRAEELRDLLREKLGLSARPLEAQITKAGRLLPKSVQRDARLVAEAHANLQNPRLARRVDVAAVEAAQARVRDFLRGIDPAERRKTRVIGVLAVIAFNVLVVLTLLIVVLRWRGIV